MYLDILGWSDYIRIYNIKTLPVNEQMKRYNYYLMEQQALQTALVNQQVVGSGGTPATLESPDSSNCIEFVADTTLGGSIFELTITTTSATTVTIDWGDDTVEEIELGGDEVTEETIEHTYAEEDTEYTVTMCFADPSVVTKLDFIGDEE
jgi:hypothetical protein